MKSKIDGALPLCVWHDQAEVTQSDRVETLYRQRPRAGGEYVLHTVYFGQVRTGFMSRPKAQAWLTKRGFVWDLYTLQEHAEAGRQATLAETARRPKRG